MARTASQGQTTTRPSSRAELPRHGLRVDKRGSTEPHSRQRCGFVRAFSLGRVPGRSLVPAGPWAASGVRVLWRRCCHGGERGGKRRGQCSRPSPKLDVIGRSVRSGIPRAGSTSFARRFTLSCLRPSTRELAVFGTCVSTRCSRIGRTRPHEADAVVDWHSLATCRANRLQVCDRA